MAIWRPVTRANNGQTLAAVHRPVPSVINEWLRWLECSGRTFGYVKTEYPGTRFSNYFANANIAI